jgi:hypothetical protein
MKSVAPGIQVSTMSQCGPNSVSRTYPMPGAQIESKSWLSESYVFSVRHATPALHPA